MARVPQLPDRLMGVRAERPAAVGDDLQIGWQLGEPLFQLIDRNRPGSFDVARLELLR